jgi:hypothetical protein
MFFVSAVMNGGFSTFLAFVLLANSKSHVFITFFRVFLLVVVFGLFHGLTLLPVILSWIGPPPNLEHQPRDDSSETSSVENNTQATAVTTADKLSTASLDVTFTSEKDTDAKIA